MSLRAKRSNPVSINNTLLTPLFNPHGIATAYCLAMTVKLMKTISDKTIKNLFITGLIAFIFIISIFALTAFSAGSGVVIGGRMSNVIHSPSNLGSLPWVCPNPTTGCPPPGDLQQRLIGSENFIHTLADVQVYGPQSSSQYIYILIPKASPRCSNPRPGAFFIGRGILVGPGANALLMATVACSP